MPTKYSNYLEINPSFESVVDIDADRRNKNLWQEYIVGKDMENLMDVLCKSLGNEVPDARRSFWINGSYGTGKSYAGIFVKHLLEEKPEVVEAFLARDSRLSNYNNRFSKCRKNGDYLVIWKTGCTGIRSGDMMLIEAEKAVRDALIEKYGDKAKLGSASLLSAVRDKLNDPTINWDFMLSTTTLGDDYGSVKELRDGVENGNLSAIQATAAVLRQKNIGMVNNLETFQKWITEIIDENGLSKSGIFLIWDEFTEYVTYSDDHTVMQQLSEFCKVKPFFMFFIVHKSTDLVTRVGGEEQYQLIIHRFHTVEFHLTADASLDLIASSIKTRVNMEEHWKDARKQVIKNIKPHLPKISELDDMAEMIDKLCPMHPMTIRLLSRVAENYAAAERTMFRFMKDRSNEDIGFVGYINRYGPDDQACWLTPEWLWDYFFTRESDFHDKDTKVAEYIRHYEDNRHLVEKNKNAHRVFKIVMLLLAVTSSVKGIYSGSRTQGGIAATVECLILCLAGVMGKEMVEDLLQTLADCKMVVLDEAANGTRRLQLPFHNDGGAFQVRYNINDKRYTRYQMFSKDCVFAQEFEKLAWDPNDATHNRMKICVCCAEALSIKVRLGEIKKELDKFPYKLGLLIVIVMNDAQFMGIQGDLVQRIAEENEPRLTIALVKEPLTDETRKKWLNAITKRELASENGQTGSAKQAEMEATTIVSNWVQTTVNGGKMIAWNGTQVFHNQYGMPQLRKTIQSNVISSLFPYAPETVVVTNTVYKPCNDGAPLAGIQRKTSNSQLKSVLNGLGDMLNITSIDEMAQASGSKACESVAQLAKIIRDEMMSGQRVVLNDLWNKLMQPPFGYYDNIACGVLMGYVFSPYKDSAFSWTDSASGSHVLDESNLKKMVHETVKGKMTTDYLSSGSQTFQLFRDYVKAIMSLTDAQVANETECWHNMRSAITGTGAPFWTLKHLSESAYENADNRDTALEIVDQMQLFIQQDRDRENIMSQVNTLFAGKGRVKLALAKSFQDRHVLSTAFRAFLFDAYPELKQLAEKMSIQPEELGDKLRMVMQGAIYTWTEEQVIEKLPDVVSEYRYLDALNSALGKVNHSIEDAQRDLANLFRVVRIPLATLGSLNKSWFAALKAMYKVYRRETSHMTLEERTNDTKELSAHGDAAMDFLKDGKTVLSDLLGIRGEDCAPNELDAIYVNLKDMSVDATNTQFEKELERQLGLIKQVRNRIKLQECWRIITGENTVKDWCSKHGAPLFWITNKEQRKAFMTLISVQKNQKTLDQDVTSACSVLKNMDQSLLTEDEKITEALLNTVGLEYREILESERNVLLNQAKMQLGNDMGAWEIDDLKVLLCILKKEQQEKAKREKLTTTKNYVQSMSENVLRDRVRSFLDAHPEFCDDFNG